MQAAAHPFRVTLPRGRLSETGDEAGAGEGAGAPLLRCGEQVGLSCPKTREGAGPRGLSDPKEAEAWAFPSPGPRGKAQSKLEWAMVPLRQLVTTSQAWEGGLLHQSCPREGHDFP